MENNAFKLGLSDRLRVGDSYSYAAAFNYNLLWANPMNFILLISVLNKKWKIAYLKLLLLSLVLIVLHSITEVQVFNIGLYPLFIFLAYRYIQLIKYYSKA